MFLLPFLASCTNKYKIEGTSSVNSLDGKMLYLKSLRDGEWVKLDSAEVAHGLFSMKGKVDSVQMVTLYMDDESIMPIVLENGKIKVNISNSDIKAVGTPLNTALYEFIEKRNRLEESIGELEQKETRMVMDGGDLDEIHSQLAVEGDSLMKEMNQYVKTFISTNYENVYVSTFGKKHLFQIPFYPGTYLYKLLGTDTAYILTINFYIVFCSRFYHDRRNFRFSLTRPGQYPINA